MALGVDRKKFNSMVNYIRGNIGGVLSVGKAKPGQMVRNLQGDFVKLMNTSIGKDELEVMVQHYMGNYNQYPDEPIIEYNEEKTLIYIKESYGTN